MKVCKIVLFGIFACIAAGNVNSAPKADYPDDAHQVQIDLLKSKNSAPLIWESATQVAQYLPDCGTMDGMYCSTPTARARCYWYQYQEPMVCVCQPNNVWACN